MSVERFVRSFNAIAQGSEPWVFFLPDIGYCLHHTLIDVCYTVLIMVEHLPGAVEAADANFANVQSRADLFRELAKLPAAETVLAAAEPYSYDIMPRDKQFLSRLVETIFQFAEASSLRRGGSSSERNAFLEKLITESVITDGSISDQIIPAIRRAIVAEFPEYGEAAAATAPQEPAPPEPPEQVPVDLLEVTDEMRGQLASLGYPAKVVESLKGERAKEIIAAGKAYLQPRVVRRAAPAAPANPAPAAAAAAAPGAGAPPATAPVPLRPRPADLAKLMRKRVVVEAPTVSTATAVPANAPGTPPAQPPAQPPLTPEATLMKALDQDPAFRAFFARIPNHEILLETQDLATVEIYRQAFTVKNKLATDLYELANSAIKGDFLLDFENPDSHLPKTGKAEFQRYVDSEALERPQQLLKLAENLQARQVLEREIAAKKAEINTFDAKDTILNAERAAEEVKRQLELVHESTRRDKLSAFVPHVVEKYFWKMAYKLNAWAGWGKKTEATIKTAYDEKRARILAGRTEDQLNAEEALELVETNTAERAELEGLKSHEKLGERMVMAGKEADARAFAKKEYKIKVGIFDTKTYSPIWIHHPDVAVKLKEVQADLDRIRSKKQTLEQLEMSVANTSHYLAALRTGVERELPPTIALVKYAQAQIRNTLTSFAADTAPEDLQRIYDYQLMLDEKRRVARLQTDADPFEGMDNVAEVADRLHEAIVARWGQRLFEVFANTALNKKGAIGEMEKVVKGLLQGEAIGAKADAGSKRDIVKGLLIEAFKKIDTTKLDGKERRLAIVGVMISCGLLAKGERVAA